MANLTQIRERRKAPRNMKAEATPPSGRPTSAASWMPRMSVRTKLFGGFALVILALVIASAVAIRGMQTMAHHEEEVFLNGQSSELTAELSIIMHEMEAIELEYLVAPVSRRAELRSELEVHHEEALQIEDELRVHPAMTAAELTELERIAEDLEAWFVAAEAGVFEHVDEGDIEGAIQEAEEGETHELTVSVLEGLATINASTTADSEHAHESAAASASSSRTLMLITALVAVVAASAIAWWLGQSISSGVNKMKVAAVGIAAGDLEQNVEVNSSDEIGEMATAFGEMIVYLQGMASVASSIADGDLTRDVQPKSPRDVLGNAFKSMITNLREVIGRTKHAAESLAESKDQLAQGAEQASIATQEVAKTTSQVAEGSSQQATNATEIGTSVTDLKRAIDEVMRGVETQSQSVVEATSAGDRVAAGAEQLAANAERAATGAGEASDVAREGSDAVQQAVEGMGRIQRTVEAAAQEVASLGQRSAEIGNIVAVIEDIASQTNLLALNAAIEAARAGEQGRGFVVVADEVRQLAERVAAATKEIAALIGGVQAGVDASVRAMNQGAEEVESGNRAAATADEALGRILAAADAVAREIAQISNGSKDLTEAGRDMAGRLVEISDVVESNTAAAQQMQASAASVADAVASIAGVAEENSAAAEEVSASAEEMSAQVEEFTASTLTLGELADDLRRQVSIFKLDGSSAAAKSSNASTPSRDGSMKEAA